MNADVLASCISFIAHPGNIDACFRVSRLYRQATVLSLCRRPSSPTYAVRWAARMGHCALALDVVGTDVRLAAICLRTALRYGHSRTVTAVLRRVEQERLSEQFWAPDFWTDIELARALLKAASLPCVDLVRAIMNIHMRDEYPFWVTSSPSAMYCEGCLVYGDDESDYSDEETDDDGEESDDDDESDEYDEESVEDDDPDEYDDESDEYDGQSEGYVGERKRRMPLCDCLKDLHCRQHCIKAIWTAFKAERFDVLEALLLGTGDDLYLVTVKLLSRSAIQHQSLEHVQYFLRHPMIELAVWHDWNRTRALLARHRRWQLLEELFRRHVDMRIIEAIADDEEHYREYYRGSPEPTERPDWVRRFNERCAALGFPGLTPPPPPTRKTALPDVNLPEFVFLTIRL
ncbi:Uncharacterized protein PBTT_04231 [Plasmodiophora brassicae]|uniref:Uncharacterized protein n=1 Tax=Plasmodiophora brassicae TaxID=37360 RepID=A0A0G4IH46_PLABS|nr:hypothetical protein PBRA_000187 [Plasmodiophora brassicae]